MDAPTGASMPEVPSRKSIADEPAKLDACVDAMARFLGHALTLKDPTMLREDLHLIRCAKEVSREWKSAPNLGQLMNEELRYAPTKAQLDHLDSLADSYEFAIEADELATRMLEACGEREVDLSARDDGDELTESELAHIPERGGIVISAFAGEEPYHSYEEHERDYGDTIALGGIGRMLRSDVRERVRRWLYQCERALCVAYDEPMDASADIDSLIDTVAKAIAKRLTLMQKQSEAMPMEVDHLSSNYLGARNEQEITRTRADAQVQARNDLLALQTLRVLACMGSAPDKAEAVGVLINKLHLVRRVVEAPPTELGLVGENAKRMNFATLSRVLSPAMPVECRVAIATRWALQHGGYAQTAINEAIRRLEGYSPAEASKFIHVVTKTRGKGCTLLPNATFAPTAGIWYAVPAPSGPSTRMGPDAPGRRIIRLTSMVWAMIGHGAFEKGVLASDIVVPVAVEAVNQARLMRQIIDHERSRCNLGCRILSFEESINDRGCELAYELNKAICELSHFSLADVYETFHPGQPLLPRILAPLTVRTRDVLGNKRSSPTIPDTYTHFAKDALAVLLPAIEHRRMAIGLPACTAPNPLADLIRSVREVHGWTPLGGRFRVAASQLRLCHPKLREALEHYAVQEGAFVHATHLRAGGGSAHGKVEFTFDSAALLQLLRM